MYSLHDALGDPQRRVTSLKPCLAAFPLDDSRFIAENAADCSFAKAPQFSYFAHAIVPFKCDAGGHHGFSGIVKAGLGRGSGSHRTPCLQYLDQV
jgi:hypothetical protein